MEYGSGPAVTVVITFAETLIVPLQCAVLLGMVLSVALHVFRPSNRGVVTQWVLPPGGFPLERPAPKRLPSDRLTLLHVYGSLFFAAAQNLEELLPALDDTPHAVAAGSLRGQSEIGSTFVAVRQRFAESLHAHDSRLMWIGLDAAAPRPARQDGRAPRHRRGERLPGHAATGGGDEPGRRGGARMAGPGAEGRRGMKAGGARRSRLSEAPRRSGAGAYWPAAVAAPPSAA
jgi:MFS superfamily sulfate permease-like transporter